MQRGIADLKTRGPSAAMRVNSFAAPPRAAGRAAPHFVPHKVFVQGFYDHDAKKGALEEPERDELATRLVNLVGEAEMKDFKIEKIV